ncbi:MAG: VanZ family protein, partial [Microbacterium sp.]|uniref:VanZ family protein n=1 Tax=Microbacterium sp. TaxID=51671 RepID=UPI0039E27E2E
MPARSRRGRPLLAAASAVYLAVLAALTLGPQPEAAGDGIGAVAAWLHGWPPTAWVDAALIEFCSNIALFVPWGALCVLWSRRRRWWLGILTGLAASGVIETVQGLLLPGRVADVRDLIANTLGAAAGALVLRA